METLARVRLPHRAGCALAMLVMAISGGEVVVATPPPPSVPISQIPMTVAVPAHPQIVFAVANSESMDGDLSGAIQTGSGSLGSSLAALNASSSPTNFTIPAGFTPPVNPGAAGRAPYTVSVSGNLVDNSPSRLNVAKAGLSSVLNTYMANADFALMDYQTSGLNRFTTWVYYMSLPGGFTFTDTPGAGTRFVANPCYNADLTASDPVSRNCAALSAYYAGQLIATRRYLVVASSSDDPAINDVLYAGGLDPVCIAYGGPSPATPFPPNFSLSTYNGGGVTESYTRQVNNCARVTGPTNAGFVPFSQEVMYAQRGFGYYTFGETANDGNVLVNLTSAGATPTAASVSTALARFSPYLAPETNSTGTAELKAAATQAPTAGILRGANRYFQTNPASSNGCPPQRYVVLMTDGLPTMDLSGAAWPPLGSAAATGYGVTATFNADGSLNTTNDRALSDAVAQLQALRTNGVKTYVIGLGAGVDPTKNPVAAQTLTALAVAGGTSAYFPATSPQAVTDDLQLILSTILAATQSTAAAAVNSTGLRTGSTVYQSQFVTADTQQDWTGELYAFAVDPTTGAVNTNPARALWSARTRLDALSPNSRVIATWDPVRGAATPFRWDPALAPAGISPTTALGGALSTFAGDTNGQNVLDYLRGSSARERRSGGAFRNRTHLLGDIVDSAPLYIGAPTGSLQTGSYLAFKLANVNRPPTIYVGAGDGMLHAIDATTGTERFAYIPAGVYSNLINLVNPYYNALHRFYVNGSPQAADVQFANNSWHTVLVGNERAGGATVFALDVTHPESITTEAQLAASVLWEFADTDMGLTFSTPAIANTNAGWLAFFGNGYNSATGRPFLYAVDAQSGALRTKIDLCAAVPTACSASAANGLSSVTVVNSGGQVSGAGNILYAGDLQGNLWRVDISDGTPSRWVASVIFQARDPGGAAQPITTAPAVSLNPRFPLVLGTMVFFGTGQLLGTSDLTSTQVQTVYGIYDPTTGSPSVVTRTNLVQQTLSAATVGSVAVRLVTNNAIVIPTQKGWFVDLSLQPGERVVTDARVERGGGVVLTTYKPGSDPCTAGGSAYLMVLNFINGGVFSQPELDVNADMRLDAQDTVSGQNPIGIALGNVYATAPTIRSGNFAATGGSGAPGCSAVKLITKSDGTIQTVCDRGGTSNRTAWWELR